METSAKTTAETRSATATGCAGPMTTKAGRVADGLTRRGFLGAGAAALGGLGCLGALHGLPARADDQDGALTLAWTSNQGDHTLDPAYNYMGWQGSYLGVYEQLFRIDGNFEPQPLLAESATTDDQGLTWTIAVRGGVTFQNGKALDASAVQASLERAMQNSPRCASALNIDTMSSDEQELTVTLKAASPFLVNELCEPVTSIIDVDADAPADTPVGTGPFSITSIDANGNLELDAFQGYWQGAPKTPHVTALYLTDDTSKVNALRSGEVKGLMNVGDDQLALFQDDPAYQVHQTNQARAHMLYFNLESPAMQDELVRRAVCRCVDRQAYVDGLYYGAAEAAPAVFPQESGWAQGVEQEGYDLEGAHALLEQAGYADADGDGYLEKDGQRLSLTLVTYEANAALPKVCEVLVPTLAQVGIEATVEVTDTIADRLGKGGWDVATMAYSTLPTGSPLTYLSAVMSSEGSANYGSYVNDEVDALIEDLRQSLDQDEQHKIVQQIQKAALGECAYFYMVHVLVNDVTAADVKSLEMEGQYDWLNYETALEG